MEGGETTEGGETLMSDSIRVARHGVPIVGTKYYMSLGERAKADTLPSGCCPNQRREIDK